MIEQPQIRAVLKGDVAAPGRHARRAHRATGENGERTARAVEIVEPEIGRAARIVGEGGDRFVELADRGRRLADGDGEKLFSIGHEPRPEMLTAVVRERAAGVVGQVEQGDLRGGGTGVARARPVKTIAAIDDAFSIGRIRRPVHGRIILGQQPRLERGHVKRVDGKILRVALRGEEQIFSVGTPAGRHVGPGMKGELPRRAAVGRGEKNVPVAGAFAGEGDPFAVRRKNGEPVSLDVLGERCGAAAFGVRDPDIAAIGEGEPRTVRAEGRLTRADHGLIGRGDQLRA